MTLRRLFAAAALVLAAALAAGCAGLPQSGTVNPGLSTTGDVDTSFDPLPLPDDPGLGASPEEITEGFMAAVSSPIDNFAIARKFLSPELALSWRADTAVTVDSSWADRVVESDIAFNDRGASVTVTVNPVATVDSAGNYLVSASEPSETLFELARNEEGEWRITSAADGIVLDRETFPLVFRPHSLQFYDTAWEHLVPDPRWFPLVPTIATGITQALVGGGPNDWLAEGVRTAFPPGLTLARDAVTVDSDQVAEVALTSVADTLDEVTLSRMRTQLERSLSTAGVRSVRFTVDGRELETNPYPVVANSVDANALVLTEDAFGGVTGDDIMPLAGISDTVLAMSDPIAAIDISGDSTVAAVQLESGQVFRVSEGALDLVDEREGLVAPTVDAHGYIWTVPRNDPQALIASSAAIEGTPIGDAWPDAAAVTQLRIAPDGVRVAATLRTGSTEWVALSTVIRDETGRPVRLGPVVPSLVLNGPGRDLAWIGDDLLTVLVGEGESINLVDLTLGGPAVSVPVPEGTVSIAGANRQTGVRLLSDSGVVLVKSGTSWQERFTGVEVLATQTGQ